MIKQTEYKLPDIKAVNLSLVPVFLMLLVLTASPPSAANDYATERQRLIKEIEFNVKQTSKYLHKQKLDPRVLNSMQKVPRHEFVRNDLRPHAYENRPLPIGYGQTISQPYIVAIMTDLVKPQKDHRVLEVGTGSGYQAAILAGIVKQVYTIEIIKPLADSASRRFRQLAYNNIISRQGDGYYGWQQHAPFDAIVVTAAAGHIPPPLLKQLKPGGKMIIPIGSRFLTQQLLLVEKDKQGKLTTEQVLPVMFVPLTGKHE